MGKKVVVLTGSPHENGTSQQLADAFIKGAEAKQTIYRFDAGKRADELHYLKVSPEETTIHEDDVVSQEVLPQLVKADVIVLCTSLYYYGINAQLKAVIDRFYEFNHELKENKAVYVLISGNSDGDRNSQAYQPLTAYFDQLCRYMRWDKKGEVLAADASNAAKLKQHVAEAKQLGETI